MVLLGSSDLLLALVPVLCCTGTRHAHDNSFWRSASARHACITERNGAARCHSTLLPDRHTSNLPRTKSQRYVCSSISLGIRWPPSGPGASRAWSKRSRLHSSTRAIKDVIHGAATAIVACQPFQESRSSGQACAAISRRRRARCGLSARRSDTWGRRAALLKPDLHGGLPRVAAHRAARTEAAGGDHGGAGRRRAQGVRRNDGRRVHRAARAEGRLRLGDAGSGAVWWRDVLPGPAAMARIGP